MLRDKWCDRSTGAGKLAGSEVYDMSGMGEGKLGGVQGRVWMQVRTANKSMCRETGKLEQVRLWSEYM